MPDPSGSTTKRRRRRSPAEARELLLSAAEELMASRGPDGVTLRDVAEAVGVTPGLVTHYFGTYSQLVRAVMHRLTAATRERLRRELAAANHVPDADTLIGILFDVLADPRRIRLFAWAHLRGDRGATRSRELRLFVDALEGAFRRTLPPREVPPRPRIERVVLLALAAAHGWAIGKDVWLASLGAGPLTPERDRELRASLTAMLRRYMAGDV